MRLLITRHGETEEMIQKIIQGRKFGKINSKGKTQIENLSTRLQKEKIDIVFSSDMARCSDTSNGIINKIKVPLFFKEELREKDKGTFTGKKRSEVDWDSLVGTFETKKPPEGECLLDVRARVKSFFEYLLENHFEENVLIVSHAGALKVFIGYLLGKNLHESIFDLTISPCSLTEFFIDKKEIPFEPVVLNDTSFLD